MMSESTESAQPAAPTPNRRNSPVRDAVTIGIFIALYIVLFFICGMTMGAIPLIMVLLPVGSRRRLRGVREADEARLA